MQTIYICLYIFLTMAINIKKINSIVIGTSADTWGLLDICTKLQYKLCLIHRDGNVCRDCKKELSDELLEIDHIIPISMGGPVCEEGNMQLLCRECHNHKTQKIDNALIEERTILRESKKFMYGC